MKKKMTFRKKGLAVLLCLVMAMSVLSGCGDSGGSGTEAEEGVLEVPDVDGDEGSFGAISLLVPDDMAVKGGRSESILTLSDEDDEDSNFVIYVTEKEVAREYISSLIDEDFNYDEVEFTLDDVKYTVVTGSPVGGTIYAGDTLTLEADGEKIKTKVVSFETMQGEHPSSASENENIAVWLDKYLSETVVSGDKLVKEMAE